MNKAIKVIVAMTPTVMLPLVSDMAGLFQKSLIMRPGADEVVVGTGIAVGCFLALVAALLCEGWHAKRLLRWALGFLAAWLALVGICYFLRMKLSYPQSKEFQEFAVRTWDSSLWLLIVAATLTIVFAALYSLAAGKSGD